ncbi:MAG: FkbM family methyltransferase [Halomonas sp.]|nr:FkbM family methyltransferase [Halomonas sp.]MBL1266199.1 FkbM family methyltransferase [Halomonas sp.]
MSFVSYAQNFEDVMLWRAFGSIENGTYIDIGAQDPVKDSVSFAFYQHGWRGLHLEPTHQYATALQQARPGEQVRQAAVGSTQGQLTFYEFADTGLSTGDQRIAEQHMAQGYTPTTHTVEVVTLDELFEEWGQTHDADSPHWLKIDVEGMEEEVIKGWQNSSARPWVIVIESHLPGSQRHAHAAWENSLIAKGYQYIYTDGINRFYLSERHPELADAFAYPPNVFDEFSLSGQASHAFCNQVKHQVHLAEVRASKAEQQLYHANQQVLRLESIEQNLNQQCQSLRTEIHSSAADIQALEAENAQYSCQNEVLQDQIALLENSRSWRITKPLRGAAQLVRRNKQRLQRYQEDPTQLKAALNRRINTGLKWLAWQVASRPKLKKAALTVLKRTPWLFERLTRRLNRAAVESSQKKQPLAYHQAKLTGRARQLQQMLTRTSPRANRESRT